MVIKISFTYFLIATVVCLKKVTDVIN